LEFIEPLQDNRVKLMPITGRSHQLRVHMLSLGNPILGDRLYANPDARDRVGRLMLHAERLAFEHPVNAEPLACFAACPF